ncbi:MAG TPA: hypothetical protein VF815_41380 [Myxococcaceae bacterium]|jgi:hypothetical protein
MPETDDRQTPAPRSDEPSHKPGEKRWTEKGDDKSPKHEGELPEGNGGTGAPASFPPHN